MGTLRLAVRLHPCFPGRRDFAIHVGAVGWEGEKRILSKTCGGTISRVGGNQLQCNHCDLFVSPKKSSGGMNDNEFEALWAWEFLRSLGPVPESYIMSSLAPRTCELLPNKPEVMHRPNWAKSGEEVYIIGHTAHSLEEIVPSIYINEAATHVIMGALLADLAERASAGMSKLYFKLE